jgi:uncharacterized protein YbbC (DUF1343 family)
MAGTFGRRHGWTGVIAVSLLLGACAGPGGGGRPAAPAGAVGSGLAAHPGGGDAGREGDRAAAGAVAPPPASPRGASRPGGAATASPGDAATVEARRVPAVARAGVATGLDVLAAQGFAPLRGKRVGLITNASGVDRLLRPGSELMAAAGVQVAALFAPEHGFLGAQQAGEAVGDARDPVTGATVYSLYGADKRPTRTMLRGIDVLVYDIQDVGARTYTYLSTLRGALEAAAEAGIEVWVLDRPDPLGGIDVDGPVLVPRFESFVGPHTIPLRYGMTPGEFARMVNAERSIGARLRVVEMKGWRRGMSFEDAGLSWVAPSPNIPTPDTCLLFPGLVLVEGTNLSEGRGTTRPFKLIGAPWLDGRKAAAALNALGLDGVAFRAASFTPTDSKHRGTVCGAIEVHVTDPARFRAPLAAAAVIAAVRRLHPGDLKIAAAGFDRLAGTDALRQAILRGDPPAAIAASWSKPLEEFTKRRAKYLIYR